MPVPAPLLPWIRRIMRLAPMFDEEKVHRILGLLAFRTPGMAERAFGRLRGPCSDRFWAPRARLSVAVSAGGSATARAPAVASVASESMSEISKALGPAGAPSVNAYTDESGNTGDDVFNVEQPDFYTLTLISKEDLNVLAAPHVVRWCQDLGVTELHGNELGVGRLEQIAESMLAFFMDVRPLFVVTVVEKRHLVTMKLFDLIFDSGMNEAVSSVHYFNRFFRLALADVVADHLSPKAQLDFWRSFAGQDSAGLAEILRRLRWNIENRCQDVRARQLILDAIDWAARNIGVFVEYPRGPEDSPNVVAFGLLLHGLQQILEAAGLRVARFVHDEQNQFAKAFAWLHEWVRKGRLVEKEPLLFPELVEGSAYDCPLTMEASHTEPALQLTDVLLWLTVRSLKGKHLPSRCESLLMPLIATGVVNSFSREQLSSEVAERKAEIMSKPLSEADLRRGAALRDQIEGRRLRKMR